MNKIIGNGTNRRRNGKQSFIFAEIFASITQLISMFQSTQCLHMDTASKSFICHVDYHQIIRAKTFCLNQSIDKYKDSLNQNYSFRHVISIQWMDIKSQFSIVTRYINRTLQDVIGIIKRIQSTCHVRLHYQLRIIIIK